MTDTFGRFRSPGIWYHLSGTTGPKPRPALILDRDGVVIEDKDFLSQPDDIALIPGITKLLQDAVLSEIPIAIVTNQSGIDRGLFAWEAFLEVQQTLERLLETHNIAVDLTIACPFHPKYTPCYGDEHAYWRKPGPGMPQFAKDLLNLDLSRSCMFGDKASDIAAARAAGVGRAVFVRGKVDGDQTGACALAADDFEVRLSDHGSFPTLKGLGFI